MQTSKYITLYECTHHKININNNYINNNYINIMTTNQSNFRGKFKVGTWSWDEVNEDFHFEPYLENPEERYIVTNGHRFLRILLEKEELIFQTEYCRSLSSVYGHYIMITDINNLVFFLMPPEFLKEDFVDFMSSLTVRRLLHSLIMYFEYFLRIVEFVLIRRDEVAGNKQQIQSEQSRQMKRSFSTYLGQYRLLVARNYSKIMLGEDDMAPFHHLKENNVSATNRDKILHDRFLSCTIQIVWIAMHRRGFYIIEHEVLRLFGSEHFITRRPEYLTFTRSERSLLYGRNYRVTNSYYQLTPLQQELKNVRKEDQPILWIGDRLYRGTDLRIASMDHEYLVPGPMLRFIDCALGILGHPKKFYNNFLELDWTAVRFANFNKDYDPFHIVRQPHLGIPNIDEDMIRKMAKQYEHFFRIHRAHEKDSKAIIAKWLRREQIKVAYTVDRKKRVTTRAQMELDTKGPTAEEIYTNYAKVALKLREKGVKVALEHEVSERQ